MAGNVQGQNFEAEVNGITIFGWNLERLSDGSWKLGIFQVAASPVSPDIEALIQTDIEAGNGDKIDHVLLSERVFACLFCEGRVTLNHLRKATETEDTVTIPGVQFLGKEYTVRVSPQDVLNERYGASEFRMATVTAEGEIV